MRLTDCLIELVAYVTYFIKTAAVRHPPFDQVKADIERLIAESQSRFHQGAFSKEDFDLARFAIFAWIDEAILSSQWNQKSQWQGEQLQRIYFQTTDAGEIFFKHLNTIGVHQNDVREVYYLCLALGFMGRYCHEGDEYLLDQLKTSNLKLLTGSSVGLPSLEGTTLFPDAYAADSKDVAPQKANIHFSPFALFCVGFPIVLYGVLFFIFRFILNNVGETFINTVR